jgi:hypothetical protein
MLLAREADLHLRKAPVPSAPLTLGNGSDLPKQSYLRYTWLTI